ncbi:MAG: rhodanese-like domain-containing protein [Patescibacteria group bacterium]
MQTMNQTIKITVLSAIIGAVVGSGATFTLQSFQEPQKPSEKELIKEFYLTENAVHVSPHGLRRKMDKGDQNYILVDTRSAQEYEREHIIGAVNIPAYSDPNTSAYEEIDRIVEQFRELIEKNPGKEIITYCYSMPCMTGRKVGKILVENDIYVKTLIIGWNEWRYFWTLWNHEHEWETIKPEDYIWKGKEPGVPVQREAPSPCGEGEFAC